MRGSEVSISVVKCIWVKCGEVLQCSDVLLVISSSFCILLYVLYTFILELDLELNQETSRQPLG
jgi:hypothetical protein